MLSSYFLTIAIPSHNATHYLQEAVHSIMAEPEFGKHVDISISDNSISDSTTKLYRNQYHGNLAIHHHRSLEYDSLDANVNRAVELATGTYVWIFGDDDLIVPGVLARLLPFLKANQPDLVVLNSQSFQDDEIIEASRVPAGVLAVYLPDQSDAFLQDLGGYLTYVGCILVRRELWLQYYNRSTIGSFFGHIDAVCAIKSGRSAHYFDLPAIRMRMHSQTWSSKSFLIWNRLYPELIWNLPGYGVAAKQSVIPRWPIHSPRRMLAARAYGRLSLLVWRQVIWPSIEVAPFFKIFTLLLCLLPRSVFSNLYRLLILRLRSRHSRDFSPALALSQLQPTRS
jgi:glycosyltransferase involved in cell wall biosynthesis